MLSSPIRGMHFHPPAKTIIQHASAGLPLHLEPEPENQYDPNAIRVLVPKEALAPLREIIDMVLPDSGLEPDEWWGEDAEDFAFLGYIGKEFTADWHPHLGGLSPTLGFDGAGKPLAQAELP